jgi:adenylylsulfate kinase
MAKTYFFSGLPCSGKTTIINELHKIVGGQIMDGDAIRNSYISKGVGFTTDDRKAHLLRVAEICKLLNKNGVNVLAGFVSPSEEVRNQIAGIIGKDNFKLIFVDAPVHTCIERDVKGMYKKAIKGEIKNFTGVDALYQTPLFPDLHLYTDVTTVEECVNEIFTQFFIEPKPEYSLFIGRYQVGKPHAGHLSIIRQVLDEGKNVCVGLRDKSWSEDKDPYTLYQRRKAFEEVFKEEIKDGRVIISEMSDITEVCYGRTPAWQVREIKVSKDIEKISATKIRNKK